MIRATRREQLAILLALLFAPGIARADHERIIILLFYEAAIIPWSIATYVLARLKVTSSAAADRSRPPGWRLVLSTIVAAAVAVLAGALTLSPPEGRGLDRIALSPLLLVIAGEPAAWWLLRARLTGYGLAVILIPIVLAGSCVANW